MKHEHKRPVTLEDLLSLKRAERPPAEFWTRFERDLRAKQLAALVEKRPWWQSLPRVFGGFSRYYLPLGATAILAVSFFSIRDFQTAPAQPAVPSDREPAVVIASGALPSMIAGATEPERIGTESAVAATAALGTAATVGEATAAGSVVSMVAMLGEHAGTTPSARSIAANLATAHALEPELASRYLGSVRGFEARALPARPQAPEPLSQIAPSEARRSRLRAAAIPVAFNTYTANSEKVARTISDERLYETVSRWDASGDRFKLKF